MAARFPLDFTARAHSKRGAVLLSHLRSKGAILPYTTPTPMVRPRSMPTAAWCHQSKTHNGTVDMSTMDEFSEDFTRLDDSALLSRRAEMRAELEQLPPGSPDHAALSAIYDRSTAEIDDRARKAWSSAN